MEYPFVSLVLDGTAAAAGAAGAAAAAAAGAGAGECCCNGYGSCSHSC